MPVIVNPADTIAGQLTMSKQVRVFRDGLNTPQGGVYSGIPWGWEVNDFLPFRVIPLNDKELPDA